MSEQIKRHVYIVDDENVIAFSLAAILKSYGFDATAFTDPRDALECAASQQPDLLISDVMMPGMSGVELGIHFRSRFPQCNVLLFSGQATTASLLDAAREQGHDFTLLAKPIHPTDLLAAIDRLTAWRLTFQRHGLV
jgi:DNA-binding NtrC family response regulator